MKNSTTIELKKFSYLLLEEKQTKSYVQSENCTTDESKEQRKSLELSNNKLHMLLNQSTATFRETKWKIFSFVCLANDHVSHD